MHGKVRSWVTVGVMSVAGWGIPAWAVPGPAAVHPGRGTLFVDDDRQQCPNAQFTSINAAVQAAAPGGHIHVCPGLYPESVTVDRTLTLEGAGPAPQLRTGDPQREAVVQTPAVGFSIDATGVDLSGFTILGDGSTTLGVDVRPTGTGNTVRDSFVSGHAVAVRLSVGGPNRQPSAIRQNRLEESNFGIAIDDNLGPSPDVTPALVTVRQNSLARNPVGIVLQRMRAMEVSHNTITDFSDGIDLRHSTEVVLSHNDLETGGFSNVGISMRNDFGNWVVDNEIRGRFRGPTIGGIFLDGSTNDLVAGNRISRMLGDGVLLSAADTNTVMLNRSDDNGADGIDLRGSSGNQLFLNSMHQNDVFDAADDNRPANTWVHNHCETDAPPGTICHQP